MADDDNAQTQQQAPEPNPALKALEVMVGVWELKGRDFTTNGEIRGRSAFEWLEGGFFLFHHFNFDYAGRKITGVEYIGYDEKSGHLKTHVFGNLGPDPLEYTWEIGEDTFTNWFGAVGSPNHYKGKFSEDRNTITGAWEWPGGGYEATMTRVE